MTKKYNLYFMYGDSDGEYNWKYITSEVSEIDFLELFFNIYSDAIDGYLDKKKVINFILKNRYKFIELVNRYNMYDIQINVNNPDDFREIENDTPEELFEVYKDILWDLMEKFKCELYHSGLDYWGKLQNIVIKDVSHKKMMTIKDIEEILGYEIEII